MTSFITVDETLANDTSRQGEVTSTLRTLTEIFGTPQFHFPVYKTSTEWTLQFSDGTIATIYDWKRVDEDGEDAEDAPGLDETVNWHIGGFDRRAVELVLEAVGK
jgi:hypothetical protein